jgi:hypothetical protein
MSFRGPSFDILMDRSRRASKVVADPGIKAHAHMLRHACGCKLANDGHDTRAIQAYLGHRNIQNTTRYTALAPHRFKEFFEINLPGPPRTGPSDAFERSGPGVERDSHTESLLPCCPFSALKPFGNIRSWPFSVRHCSQSTDVLDRPSTSRFCLFGHWMSPGKNLTV